MNNKICASLNKSAETDKATNENNVTEDWGLIMDIVDLINHSNRYILTIQSLNVDVKYAILFSNYSKKEIIKVFIKKLNDKDPHVIEHTLTVRKRNRRQFFQLNKGLVNSCVCVCVCWIIVATQCMCEQL